MCLYKLTHSGRLVNFNGVAVIPHSVCAQDAQHFLHLAPF